MANFTSIPIPSNVEQIDGEPFLRATVGDVEYFVRRIKLENEQQMKTYFERIQQMGGNKSQYILGCRAALPSQLAVFTEPYTTTFRDMLKLQPANPWWKDTKDGAKMTPELQNITKKLIEAVAYLESHEMSVPIGLDTIVFNYEDDFTLQNQHASNMSPKINNIWETNGSVLFDARELWRGLGKTLEELCHSVETHFEVKHFFKKLQTEKRIVSDMLQTHPALLTAKERLQQLVLIRQSIDEDTASVKFSKKTTTDVGRASATEWWTKKKDKYFQGVYEYNELSILQHIKSLKAGVPDYAGLLKFARDCIFHRNESDYMRMWGELKKKSLDQKLDEMFPGFYCDTYEAYTWPLVYRRSK